MKISKPVGWQICWAALFAGLFVVVTPDCFDKVALVWLMGIVVAAVFESHRPRLGSVFTIVRIHVVVGVAVIAMAISAPVKTKDRLLVRHVTLPKAEMSLGELKALADDDLRSLHFPVRVRISFEPVDSGRFVRWSGREMTLRDFLAAIEGQTRLRHQFGGCGNGTTILFGGNCCFGVFLCADDDRK
jgi:hypothetical protein